MEGPGEELQADHSSLEQLGWTASASCLVPTRGRDGHQASADAALLEAVNAVLLHQSSVQDAVRSCDLGAILVLLKKGCLKSLRSPGAVDRAAEHAGPVLGFLIDFVVQRPDHILQVAEVINILLTSDDWVAALQEVMQDLVLQLTSEQQAVLGVQNDVLLAQLPQTAVDLAHEQASKLLQDAAQVRKELDRVRTGLGEGGLRFKSSVQELRFEPSYRSGGHVSAETGDEGGEDASPSGWRSTTTPDGNRYYYHQRTKEIRRMPPGVATASASEASGRPKPWVGERVEVFSNSVRRWCPGFVERVGRAEVMIAFQLPHARANDWCKKTLPLGHPELRWVSRPPEAPLPAGSSVTISREMSTPMEEKRMMCKTSSGFFGTNLPTNWTEDELQMYDALYTELETKMQSHPPSTTDDMDPVAAQQSDFIAQSGLPRRALREIWQVANPHLKANLGLEEFRACCRLVGHCQAITADSDDKDMWQSCV
ncbi:unnamed protein product [Symbiodinium sp. CCMP2592]|nr:unnamed protein product [Symbiodinium sp. CCMP2592]